MRCGDDAKPYDPMFSCVADAVSVSSALGHNVMRDRDADGLTWLEWATELFEHEYCCECGGDAMHHAPASVFGNWFAQCLVDEVED